MDTQLSRGRIDRPSAYRPTLSERRAARQAVGLHPLDSCPIQVVVGNARPALAGHGYHYTNKRGDLVRYPAAYAKRGWSSLTYRASTRRIVVGDLWLVAWAERNRSAIGKDVRRALSVTDVGCAV